MWGHPPQLTKLASGSILCSYAHRRHPYGVRACLSRDFGDSWDIDSEKILRDDSLPGMIDYPTSVQLPDQSILTLYTVFKIPHALRRDDDWVHSNQDLLIHRRAKEPKPDGSYVGVHAVLALSRYSEDFVCPGGAW